MFGEVCAMLAAFCWALGASLYGRGVRERSPLEFNFVRSVGVALFSFLLLFLLGNWGSLFSVDVAELAVMGLSSVLVLAVGDSLYFFGLKTIGVTKTVPITYSYSILVILLSVLVLGEDVTLQVVVGTVAIIVGVWLVANKALDRSRKSNSSVGGVLASLGTVVCWGFGVVLFKILLENNDPFVLSAGRMLFLLPTLGVLSAMSRVGVSSSRRWTKTQLSLALLSGLVALGVGDTLLYFGLDSANMNIVAPLTSTTPIFSAIIAVLFLGEKVSVKVVIGTFLVTVGAMLLFM